MSLEGKYSGDEKVYMQRTQQDWYDGIIDNFKSYTTSKITEENYQLHGAFNMDRLI